MLDDGRALLLDWERRRWLPLFSLDRLLDDAHELSTVETVRECISTPSAPAIGAVERAMRLVPLKLAHENRAFARALAGLVHTLAYHTTAGAGSEAITNGYLNTWLSDLLAP